MRQGSWVAVAILLAIVFMAMSSRDLNTVVSLKDADAASAMRGELVLDDGDNIVLSQDASASMITIAFNTGTNAGPPAVEDCDSDAERGDVILDTTNNRLYICNGATRGWDYIGLSD